MNKRLGLLPVVTSLGLLFVVLSAFGADLHLKKTLITTGGPLSFSTSPTEAIDPTTVRCPSSARWQCTLRIELSSQFSTVPEGMVAAVSVLVDESPDQIEPANPVGFDSTSNSGASNVRTFSWVKRDLDPGSHTIRVFFFLAGTGDGRAGSFSRILTVDAYVVAAQLRNDDRERHRDPRTPAGPDDDR